jgi:hypothetical protein
LRAVEPVLESDQQYPALKGRIVPKKTTKAPGKKSASAKPVAKAEAPVQEPAAQASAAKPKPVVPPKPIPAHQQFLSKGVKPQAMMKARIIRHQGR